MRGAREPCGPRGPRGGGQAAFPNGGQRLSVRRWAAAAAATQAAARQLREGLRWMTGWPFEAGTAFESDLQ